MTVGLTSKLVKNFEDKVSKGYVVQGPMVVPGHPLLLAQGLGGCLQSRFKF